MGRNGVSARRRLHGRLPRNPARDVRGQCAMCGIAGFIATGSPYDPRAVVRRMVTALRHRGPDDEGEYLDEQAALGACRLSIVDLAGGRQPIGNETGTVHAVLNGEIYNFRELRARLQQRGHRFTTQSDTEVLVHAYEQDGEDFVADLDGMFALALWDGPARKLVLARDRMGEKPLYYYDGPGVFVFGSELRALLEHPAVPRTLDLRSLARYLLFDAVPAPHSILDGIAKLAPAHTVVVSPGAKPNVTPYWALSFSPAFSVGEAQWRDRLVGQIEGSVRSRLGSDVPVGVFVSGGIDSGAVAAFASRHANTAPLRTFAIGFDTPSYDERGFARIVATRFGTEHRELVFTATDALALIGDGGDEIFCGYPTFLADAPARWLQAALWPSARRLVTRLVDRLPSSSKYGSLDFLLKQFMRGLPYPAAVRTQLLLGGITATEQERLLSPSVRHAITDFDPYAELGTAIEQAALRDPVECLIYHHARFYLADQTLVAMDRASMAAGLEVRAPFLDPALIELAGRIPGGLKLRGWTTKYILKRAFAGTLPTAIVQRRKQGLGVPIAAWLRGPLRGVMETRLAPARVRHRGLFEATAVTRLVAEHLDGRRNHRKILWALMMLDAWCDHYLPHQCLTYAAAT